MNKAKLLVKLAIFGGIGYFIYRERQNKAMAAAQAAAAAAQANPLTGLPTDSMMSGIMSGAVQGLIKDAPRQHHNRHLRKAGQSSFTGPVRVLR